ncbi:MAG: glycosyltransferase family protein, partial [Balneolaceae bacterium]|nr:glycosyltransferase family protein [Balneolaceae bacterium]
MKILYGIQGTGHGHISRARELLPELGKHAEVDVLVSGYNSSLDLDNPVQYCKYGISMTYDSNGGVSIVDTLRSLRPFRFITDIQSIPITEYDLVISDYEPVTAWAAKAEKIPCWAISHQAAFLSDRTPRPAKRSPVAEAILKHFAPAGRAVGFHYEAYDRFIEPPIIRSEILELSPRANHHIAVY